MLSSVAKSGEAGSSLGKCLRRAPFVLIVLVSLGVIGASVFKMTRQTLASSPIDIWEASTIGVAAQVAQGQPMYARMNEPDGMEPGLYSPLQPFTLAAIFRVTGPNLVAGRLINLLSGLAFILIFIRALELHRNFVLLLFGLALLFALDRQLSGLWDLPRADAVPLLCSLLYLCASFRACTQNSMSWALLGHVALLLGLLWKQTIVAVAAAPFLATIVTPAVPRRIKWVFFIGPPILGAATALVIAWLSPNLYDAMFRGLAKYSISLRVMALYGYGLLLSTPLIWMTFWWLLFSPDSKIIESAKMRWALAAAVAAIPMNFLAAAKTGGGQNSFAHMLYALGAVILLCAPGFFNYLRTESLPVLKRCVFGTALSVALIVEWATVVWTPSRYKTHRPAGDSGRATVVSFARSLPGKVVSPQDPTIALLAKGYAGVSAANEYDRRTWRWPLPKVIREMEQADYVITWGKTNTWQTFTFDEGFQMLPQLGFEPMPVPGLENSDYQVWKQKVPKPSTLPQNKP